jgi:cysteine synthase
MRNNLKIANSILDLIGDIPLVRLNRVGRETGCELLVKPEYLNPSGSIKDRIAKRMIDTAERDGQLQAGTEIIEATTGNTGAALAMVAAVKGYQFTAYAPSRSADRIRKAIMQAYGAQVEIVDAQAYVVEHPEGDHGGRVELVGRQICRDREQAEDDVWWSRQFSNPEHVDAHREGTAAEILDQTDQRLDVFVASVGTGGTLLGVAQALKAHDPKILIVGVEPSSSPTLGAPDDYPIMPGLSDGVIPQIWKNGLVDRVLAVSDAEAIEQAHALATLEGLFCGISSGANVVACLRLAQEFGPGKRIVTVLPDSRDRYLDVEKYVT